MNNQTTMERSTETQTSIDIPAAAGRPKARTATPGDVVHVRFVGRLDDGTVFDSSSRLGPLEFTLGEGDVIPGVDDAVRGLTVGETLTTRISPDRGFGQRRDDLMVTVPVERFPGDEPPAPGDYFELKGPASGPVRVRVIEVHPNTLKVDANHPLAGCPLNFEVELLKIASAA